MKKVTLQIIIGFAMLMCSMSMYSQIVIPMQQDNGVYRVQCKVNGAKMKMVFDTGASVVSLSLNIGQYLYDNDYFSDSDILEQGQSQTADGRIVDHLKINIKDLEIGGQHIENVAAIVMANQSAPLLLGQSAIQRLGRIQIEGNNLIILDACEELTDEEIDQYAEIADQAMKDQDFAKSELYYSKLYNGGYLNNKGLWEYAFACYLNHNYKKALQIYKELENSEYSKSDAYNFVTIQSNLFKNIACCYIKLDMYGYSEYVDKAIAIVPQHMKLASGKSVTTDVNIIPCIYENIAASLMGKEQYSEATSYYRKALGSYAKHHKLSITALWNIMVGKNKNLALSNDESIQFTTFYYAKCKWLSYSISDEEFNRILLSLARNNNKSAKIFCNANDIKY